MIKKLDHKLRRTIRSVQARNDPQAYRSSLSTSRIKAKPITLAKVPHRPQGR